MAVHQIVIAERVLRDKWKHSHHSMNCRIKFNIRGTSSTRPTYIASDVPLDSGSTHNFATIIAVIFDLGGLRLVRY